MGCKICGRSSCSLSFHSTEEQEVFDSIEEAVKGRLLHHARRLYTEEINGVYCVALQDVIDLLY